MAQPTERRSSRVFWGCIGAFGAGVGVIVILAILLVTFVAKRTTVVQPVETIVEARANWTTTLSRTGKSPQPHEALPGLSGVEIVNFESDGRLLFGYFGKPSGPGPHPAVVLCHGGFAVGGGDVDMARPFLKAGYAIFVPAWRGENGNPGNFELYYGEADDVVAATEFVASLPSVKPDQVFVFGHSAGGTIALLAAELSSRPRGVSACGPTVSMQLLWHVIDQSEFPEVPYSWDNQTEHILRSPASFAKDLTCPAQLVFGEQEALLLIHGKQMVDIAADHGKEVTIETISGADHFSALQPATMRAITFFDQLRKRQTSRDPLPLRYAKGKQPLEEQFLEQLAKLQGEASSDKPSASEEERPFAEIEAWTDVVDAGSPPITWSGFARNYIDSPLSADTIRNFPGNGHWVATRKMGKVFGLASLDGSKRHVLRGEFPNLFERVPNVTFQPGGVSVDGRYFAVQWIRREERELTAAWISVHDSSDGRARHMLEGYADCQFVEGGHLLVWSDTWFSENVPRKDSDLASLNLATGELNKGISLKANAVIALSPGGKYLCTLGTVGEKTELQVHNVASCSPVSKGIYTNAPVGFNAVFSQDGHELATCSDGRLTVWDLSSGQIMLQLQIPQSHRRVTWLDGRRFLLTDGHMVFDRESEQLVSTLAYRASRVEHWDGACQEGPWFWESKDDVVQLRRYPVEQLQTRASNEARNSEPPRIKLIVAKSESSKDKYDEDLIRQVLAMGIEEALPVAIAEQAPYDAEVEIEYFVRLADKALVEQLTILGEPVGADVPRAGVMNDKVNEISLQLELGVFAPRESESENDQRYWQSELEFRGVQPTVDLARDRKSEALINALAHAVHQLVLPTPDRLRLNPDDALELEAVDSASELVKPTTTAAELHLKVVGQTELVAKLQPTLFQTVLEGRENRVFALAFVQDQGKVKLLAAKQGPEILQYDLQGGQESIKGRVDRGFIWQFTTTRDGAKWAGIGPNLLVLGTGSSSAKWVPGAHWPRSATLSDDGVKLFVPAEFRQPRVTNWDVGQLLNTGEDKPTILVEGEEFVSVKRIPGSQDVLCLAKNAAWRVNPTTTKPVWKLTLEEHSAIRFSPDGRQLLYHKQLRSASVLVFTLDAMTGKTIQVQQIVEPISGPRLRHYSPDGARFVTRLDNGRYGVYGSDELLQRQLDLEGIKKPFNKNCVAWSPDGRYLAFMMRNEAESPESCEIRVWDLSD